MGVKNWNVKKWIGQVFGKDTGGDQERPVMRTAAEKAAARRSLDAQLAPYRARDERDNPERDNPERENPDHANANHTASTGEAPAAELGAGPAGPGRGSGSGAELGL